MIEADIDALQVKNADQDDDIILLQDLIATIELTPGPAGVSFVAKLLDGYTGTWLLITAKLHLML